MTAGVNPMDRDENQSGRTGLISVVIPSIDRGPAILETVESVLANDHPNFEVIVGDQSNDPRARESLAPHVADGRVRYFPHPRKGVALNRNLGASHARGEILAYTDDDCTVPPSWLRTIAHAFHGDRRIGMVFGNILAGPHDRQRGFVQAYLRKTAFTATKATQKHLVEGIGACMAIRRDVWETVGGFDLALGTGARFRAAEDTDLSLRVLLAGFHVHESPGISVVHHGFRGWEQRPAMFRNYLYGLGAMTGKHLRCGNWQVLSLMLAYAFRWSVTGPVVDLGPRPPRLLRLQAYLSGLMAGALARSDRRQALFQPFSRYSGEAPPAEPRA